MHRSRQTSTLLFASIAAALIPTWPSVAEEQDFICRYCEQHHHKLADFGFELEGSGRRYAPDRLVDIIHIKLDVTPDFERRTVAGTTTISFTPIAEPLRQLRLDAVNLGIHAVRCDAGTIDYVSTAKDLTIAFDPPIPVGNQVALEIDHSAQPTRGLYFRTPAMGYPESDTHCWTQGETHEARFWFPCFDYPNERSTTEVVCHVPSDMTVLSNGRMISQTVDQASGLKTVHWLQDKPHVNYLICLVAGHFKKLEKVHRDVPLGFFTQPSLFEHAENSFRDTAQIMAYFEDEIGMRYPWHKYDQVTIRDFVAGGMENTTLTTLTHRTIFSQDTEEIRQSRRLDAHELAHQWFGDLVTCKDWSHLWLNEGFATYYTHLYEGHKFGRDAMLYGLYRDARDRVLTKGSDPKPIVYRRYKNPSEQFDYRAYPKGSWVLHMLRSQLGDQLYRRCIKTYLERHAFTSVVTEDLNRVIEETSGKSFDQFFDQWVYHARHPSLKVSYRWLPSEKLAHVTVEQTHETNGKVLLFRFPTQLRFVLETDAVDHDIEIIKPKHDFYVPLASQPKVVRFDPQYTVLADIEFKKSDEMLFAQLGQLDDVIGRIRAIEQLATRKTHKAAEHLEHALRHDSFYGVRIEASKALGKHHNDEAFEVLRTATEQPDARVRQRVVEDLGQFYRPDSLTILRDVIRQERNPAIRASAIRALAVYGPEDTRELLAEFLDSDSFRNELADAAISTIRKQASEDYGDRLLDVLKRRKEEFTSHGYGQGLETLAQLAQDSDDKSAVSQFLRSHLNEPKTSIRRAAIRGLGTLRDRTAMALLESIAAGQDDRQAAAAKSALERIRNESPTVPAELREMRKQLAEFKERQAKLSKQLEELKAKPSTGESVAVKSDEPASAASSIQR